jgi:hypothetical protein
MSVEVILAQFRILANVDATFLLKTALLQKPGVTQEDNM